MNFFIQSLENLPEIFLSIMILLQIVTISLYKIRKELNNIVQFQTWIILFFCLVITFTLFNESRGFSSDNITFSYLNIKVLKFIILLLSLCSFGSICLSYNYEKIDTPEFFTIVLMAILSTLLLITSLDFLTLFLLLEMQSLSFYILAAIKKNSIFSIKAGQNYFIFNSITSCILLLNISMLYGFYGTLSFVELFSILNEYSYVTFEELHFVPWHISIVLGVILIKVAVVPFHFWVIDVYDGAPLCSTIVFMYLPKLMLFDLMIKINKIFWVFSYELSFLYIIIGLITISYGGIITMNKYRFKLFLIYSSISQMGFPILLLGLWTQEAWSYVYFFVFIYIITSLSFWIFYVNLILHSSKNNSIKKKCFYLSDLSSINSIDTKYLVILLISLFSSAGIPPFAGFYAKSLIILNTEKSYMYSNISKFLVFLTLFAVFYYLRVIKIFIFEEKKKNNQYKFSILGETKYLAYNSFVLIVFALILTFSFFSINYWLTIIKDILLSS